MKIEEIEPAVLSVNEFTAHYVTPKETESQCGDCPNYGTIWTCPPFDFDPLAYWSNFQTLWLMGSKIHLTEKEKEHPMKMLRTAHNQIRDRLLNTEKKHPGSRCLAPGFCHLCPEGCSRRIGDPCRKPDKLRYSIEAIGGDAVSAGEDLLGIRLLWEKDGRPPEYYTLIYGLLLP